MKKAQNLVEYLLIAGIVALIVYTFSATIDLGAIRNYVFMRPSDSNKIKIEAMTE